MTVALMYLNSPKTQDSIEIFGEHYDTQVVKSPDRIFLAIVRGATSKAQFHTPLLSRTGAVLPSHSPLLFYAMKIYRKFYILGGILLVSRATK